MSDFYENNILIDNNNSVTGIARVAIYDDLKSPPQIFNIEPSEISKFIENLSSLIYNESHKRGGKIPYTVIREISENFIHANFLEIVVSVLDDGNTIRFSDQGPGFFDKDNAQLPGFTSATENMKKYIRGVGSGLPTVKDYLDYSEGYLKIENNIKNGAVVTISLVKNLKDSKAFSSEDKEQSNKIYEEKIKKLSPSLSDREKQIIKLIFKEGPQGISQIHKITNIPMSSVHKILTGLEQLNIICCITNKKRILTDQGFNIAQLL